MLPDMLDLVTLRDLYAGSRATPRTVADELAARMAQVRDPAIFITAVGHDGLLGQVDALLSRAPVPNSLPLWGIPFAVKDNIDVAGLPTTAGCPAYAYVPRQDAFVVARLKAAGAFVIGKTNLDQFATGLSGTRSPYGAPRCAFNADYISGGSSSGSAVAVALGLASFALGTDTAGSGRVPASINNIVGIKPTPGRLSTSGLVPACRSLDVISVFAGCVADGIEVRRISEAFDPADPFCRPATSASIRTNPRVGVLKPEHRAFYGDEEAAALYDAAVAHLIEFGAEAVPFDYGPFLEAASLLYNGPWVAERRASLSAFHSTNSADFDPSVRTIIEGADRFSAVDAFRGHYALEALRRETEATWANCDTLLLPTTPTIYTVQAMRADPIALNSNLGHYTNFANLFGLAAIAVPAGFRSNGLPFGVTLVGPRSSDDALAFLADHLHRVAGSGMGFARALPARRVEPLRGAGRIEIAVVGAHLSGMPLNKELFALGGTFVRSARTAYDYRLFVLPESVPPKPGLIRDVGAEGPGIEAEIWSLEAAQFAVFVAAIPAPLGIGRISMEDGSAPSGFICESWAVAGAQEITQLGSWRAFERR